MPLNIKNEEAHALSRELADLTGESLTEAVTTAVRERLERLRPAGGAAGRAATLRAIAKDTAWRLDAATRSVDHGELLYGEDGLPR